MSARSVASQGATNRQAERERRSLTSTIAAIAARVVTVGISFIAIPLTIGYLGADRYGVLVALTSLMTMFTFADLGLGNGLLNVVSQANGRDDREAAVRAVSSAFFMLIVIAAIMVPIAVVGFQVIPWGSLFAAPDASFATDVAPAAAVLLATVLLGLPLGVVERIRLAFQEQYVSSYIAIAVGIGGLVVLVASIWLQVGLPLVVAVIALPPVIALALNGVELFWLRRPWLMPRIASADRHVAARLARLGWLFLVLQLAVAVAYQSDVVVAGVVLGPAAAATYAVTLKFFLVTPALVGLYLTTLWPAYTEALARGDIAWVRRTMRRSVAIAVVLSGVASVGLVIFGGIVIRAWTNGEVNPPIELLVGAALWAVTYATFNAIGIVLNAASVLTVQVVMATAMAGMSITLSVVLANAIGLPGVVWGTLIAYVTCTAIPLAVLLPRLWKEITTVSNSGPGHGEAINP
jgi:O-antigen/teichoic acid export membrane protein